VLRGTCRSLFIAVWVELGAVYRPSDVSRRKPCYSSHASAYVPRQRIANLDPVAPRALWFLIQGPASQISEDGLSIQFRSSQVA
jgi:hypothetical protein